MIILCLKSSVQIHFRGETYHRSEFITCGFQADDLPVFSRHDGDSHNPCNTGPSVQNSGDQ